MQKKKKHVGRRILVFLLALILLAAAAFVGIPMTESVKTNTADRSADWMADLDDALRLNEIVLPGTHDSATQYVQLAFFSKCQAISVGEQLEAGFRYLDIRLGLADGGIKLMHGFTNCKTGPMPWDEALYLDTVLEQCYAFLRAHPSETVVFAVKQEHGDQTAQDFAERLEAVIAGEPELWYLGNEIPTLGEARGKLVLMRRYVDRSLDENAACAGVLLMWPNQNGHEDPAKHVEMTDNLSYRLWVQDRYEYGAEDKWTAFLKGLEEPAIGKDDLSIHFLSTKGTLPYGHPYYFSHALNTRLLELPTEKLRGWIVVDFGDAALASAVWRANFQN